MISESEHSCCVLDKEVFRPIFVVGASRSGTTMLNRILGRHDSILAMNELHFFQSVKEAEPSGTLLAREAAIRVCARLLSTIRKGIWKRPDARDDSDARNLLSATTTKETWSKSEIFQLVLQAEAEAAGAVYVTDHTPRNIFYAHQLLNTYPQARVIHMVRDPRAVLYSQKNRWRLRALASRQRPLWDSFQAMANYHPFTLSVLWKKATKLGLELGDHPRYKMISYEKLVNNPEKHIRDLCTFLNVRFEAQMLNVPQMGSSHRFSQTDKLGIHSESLYLWRQGLAQGDILVCESLTGTLMKQLGYSRERRHISYIQFARPFARFPLHLMGVLMTNPTKAFLQFNTLLTRKED
ncbi:MAG: sulfotransferase [Deltaproteobacteria bacterium]|nr:sulfotransferase [Deltaproteobacteria bacterium]